MAKEKRERKLMGTLLFQPFPSMIWMELTFINVKTNIFLHTSNAVPRSLQERQCEVCNSVFGVLKKMVLKWRYPLGLKETSHFIFNICKFLDKNWQTIIPSFLLIWRKTIFFGKGGGAMQIPEIFHSYHPNNILHK